MTTYKVWEWDMKEDTETVIAKGLTLEEAMILVKIHPISGFQKSFPFSFIGAR